MGVGIYDARGRRVRQYEAKDLGAGQHLLLWDGRNEQGKRISAGNYFYRVSVNGQEAGSGKLAVLR